MEQTKQKLSVSVFERFLNFVDSISDRKATRLHFSLFFVCLSVNHQKIMSSKRKTKSDQRNSNDKPSTSKKMKVEDDAIESESDEIDNDNPIATDTKLRDDILKRFQCEPGKLMIAGNVEWNYVDKKDNKRNELHVFNRFTDGKVTQIAVPQMS